MNVSLSRELEKYVQKKVESGLYTSISEVIRESLRLMHSYEAIQQHRIAKLNQDIDTGLEQLASGKKISADESYERIKSKIDKIGKRHK